MLSSGSLTTEEVLNNMKTKNSSTCSCNGEANENLIQRTLERLKRK